MEFHQCHAKPHSISFFTTVSKTTKEIFAQICWQLKTPTRTWKCPRCIMQMSSLYASDFPFKNFGRLAQHAETIRKNVSIRVRTTINHISNFTFLCFLPQYQRQRKYFFSERKLKKVLRDTLTRAAWLGPSNFWLVLSEHAHASYPGLSFRPPGFSPYRGREDRRVRGLD